MKKVLIICGTGVATSTVVAQKVRQHLQSAGVQATVEQGKVMDLVGHGTDADLVVATTDVPASVTVPVIRALPLLTGMGEAQVLDEITAALA